MVKNKKGFPKEVWLLILFVIMVSFVFMVSPLNLVVEPVLNYLATKMPFPAALTIIVAIATSIALVFVYLYIKVDEKVKELLR